MDRIIDVSARGTYIRLEAGVACVRTPENGTVRIPLRDISAFVVSEPAASFSAAVLAGLAEHGILTVICGRNHLPVAIVEPTCGKNDQTRILNGQVAASVPVKKQLWQTLVRRKLLHQAAVLEYKGVYGGALRTLAARTRSGDVENIEGTGARLYWRLMDVFERRDRMASDANRLFNYAYMVLLSMVGRTVCAAGLNPGLGVHHRDGRNPFCLACDLMEPFRAVADVSVLEWLNGHPGADDVTPEAKRRIVGLLTTAVMHLDDREVSISTALTRAAVSLRESLLSSENLLELAEFHPEEMACG